MRSHNKKNRRYSPRATLAAVGVKIGSLKLLDPIKKKVVILQKSVRPTPAQKLQDAFIAILAGAHGLSEINTRVRGDEALQRAFGRGACADQSVVQETLNACTALNVQQVQQALDVIFRMHSGAYRHDYEERLQVLDADMTGMPCGPNQEGSRKGYFGENNIRWGRQLGRVVAAHYEEIVVDQLFTGDAQLTTALQPLVLAAEEALELDDAKRRRTVIRVDAGGGSLDDVNWCLLRGYHFHGKTFSSHRAESLAATVEQWYVDGQQPDRQVGWITVDDPDYVRPVRRLAMRWKKKGVKLNQHFLDFVNGQPCIQTFVQSLSQLFQIAFRGEGGDGHDALLFCVCFVNNEQFSRKAIVFYEKILRHIFGFNFICEH